MILSKPILNAVVLFLLSLCYFGVLLPLLLRDQPYSKYFNLFKKTHESLITEAKNLDLQRRLSATLYFQNMIPEHTLLNSGPKSVNDVYIAVAIITVNRKSLMNEEFSYVVQSASAIDKFAKSSEFGHNTFVFVCNTDKTPEKHKYAQFLKDYTHFIERYGNSSFTNQQLTYADDVLYSETFHDSKFVKETFDYTFCLKAANLLKPKYILMLQDDAVAHEDLAPVLKHVLEHQLVDRFSPERGIREFGYLKLYFPEFWQGYFDGHVQTIDLVCVGVIGGGIGVLLQYLASNRHRRNSWVYTIGLFIGATYMTLTVLLIGRQNVNELRRTSKHLYQLKTAPECCIPAQLYPSKYAQPLSDYLTSKSSYLAVDIRIPLFFNDLNVRAYQVDPNLFYHVGFKTSLSGSFRDPRDYLFHITV